MNSEKLNSKNSTEQPSHAQHEQPNTGDQEVTDTTQKAVVERIVAGRHAVLLVGDEEREHIVQLNQLPAEAKEGSWLTSGAEGAWHIDHEETAQRTALIADKMARLKKGSRSSRFKKE